MGELGGCLGAIVFVVAIVFGMTVGIGALLYFVYNAVAPESWIALDFWPCVGIAFLVSALLGSRGATVVRR